MPSRIPNLENLREHAEWVEQFFFGVPVPLLGGAKVRWPVWLDPERLTASQEYHETTDAQQEAAL